MTLGTLLFFLGVVIWLYKTTSVVVPEKYYGIRVRNGIHRRDKNGDELKLEPGRHWKWPLIERILVHKIKNRDIIQCKLESDSGTLKYSVIYSLGPDCPFESDSVYGDIKIRSLTEANINQYLISHYADQNIDCTMTALEEAVKSVSVALSKYDITITEVLVVQKTTKPRGNYILLSEGGAKQIE